jgi:hypothetical protein
VRFRISLERDPPRPSARILNRIEPKRSAGTRVAQRAHDRIPRFAIGVATEQQNFVHYGTAGTLDPLPESCVLTILHVIKERVFDNRAMSVMCATRVVTMRQVEGRYEYISSNTAVPPECESLQQIVDQVRKTVCYAQCPDTPEKLS